MPRQYIITLAHYKDSRARLTHQLNHTTTLSVCVYVGVNNCVCCVCVTVFASLRADVRVGRCVGVVLGFMVVGMVMIEKRGKIK